MAQEGSPLENRLHASATHPAAVVKDPRRVRVSFPPPHHAPDPPPGEPAPGTEGNQVGGGTGTDRRSGSIYVVHTGQCARLVPRIVARPARRSLPTGPAPTPTLRAGSRPATGVPSRAASLGGPHEKCIIGHPRRPRPPPDDAARCCHDRAPRERRARTEIRAPALLLLATSPDSPSFESSAARLFENLVFVCGERGVVRLGRGR
jgi:hypothetical protein